MRAFTSRSFMPFERVLLPTTSYKKRSSLRRQHSVVELQASPLSYDDTNALNATRRQQPTFGSSNEQRNAAAHSLLGVRSLGVDYGLVRTGVAISVGYNPKPLTTLTGSNSSVVDGIVRMAAAENAQQIIVGLPLHKNGTIAPQTVLTKFFATNLVCACHAQLGPRFPVYLWDERYTSKEAASRFKNSLLHKELDAEAAAIILEHYYQENGVGAERVHIPNDDRRQIADTAWELTKIEKQEEMITVRMERERRMDARRIAMERNKVLEEEESNNDRLQSFTQVREKKKKNGKRRRIKPSSRNGDSNGRVGGDGGTKWTIL